MGTMKSTGRVSDRDVFTAVKKLRKELGDTQQQFAQRTGLAIRSVARFEAERIPSPLVLATLADHADANGLKDIGNVLRRAMMESIGTRGGRFETMSRGPVTPEESDLEQAFRRCVFEHPNSDAARMIRQLLTPIAKQLHEENRAALAQLERNNRGRT
jgi:transcriptional regulator with XRE-family HTH domain